MTDFDRVRGAAGEVAKNRADTPRYSKTTGHRVRNRYNYSSLDPVERKQQKYTGIAGGAAGALAGAHGSKSLGDKGPAKVNAWATKLHEAKKISLSTRMSAHKYSHLLGHGGRGEVIAGAAALGGLAGNSVGRTAMASWQNRGSTTKKPIRKSQQRDGSYKPVNSMSSAERSAHRTSLTGIHGRGNNAVHGPANHFATVHAPTGKPVGRDLQAAFTGHGVQHQIKDAVNATHRPSTVHPNIRYGTSIGPEMEKTLDTHINPDLAKGSRHPIVFHRANLGMEGVQAAAAASHKTLTKGHGHVILNTAAVHHDGTHGPLKPGITMKHVVNHELAHAMAHNKSPARFDKPDGSLNHRRTLGEEARADAVGVKGPGVYRRSGVVGGRVRAAAQQQIFHALKSKIPLPDGTSHQDVIEGLKAHAHYNDVHRKVRIGRDGFKGYAHDFAVGASLKPEKYVAGAAIAGAVAHHEWKKHHVNTASSAIGKARAFDETKHKREHGKFSPMNHAGAPERIPLKDWKGNHTGFDYTRVASNEKAFNNTYASRRNGHFIGNTYAGGVYGALAGIGGVIAAAKHHPELAEHAGASLTASSIGGAVLGGTAANAATRAYYHNDPKRRAKFQAKADRKDMYLLGSVKKQKSNHPPIVSTGGGAVLGGYLAANGGMLAAARGKNPERLSDLRASFHNHAHSRAVRQYASHRSTEHAAEPRTKRGKYGAFEDLSPKAKKVVTTAAKLKHVAATDREFQRVVPGIVGVGAGVAGAVAGGALAHHNKASWKARNLSPARVA